MAKHNKRISNSKSKIPPTPQERAKRLEQQHTEWTAADYRYLVKHCWGHFMLSQSEKGNSKETQAYYSRCYKKIVACPLTENGEATIKVLEMPGFQFSFIQSLGDVSQQTINSYLRGLRSFGNFCVEKGYIDSFECHIKEVTPPAKQVYTDREIAKLMKKPNLKDFGDYRMYCIIGLILNTGARSNTILNIKICDVELDDGYITFNKLKNNGIVRLGLERKVKNDLAEWITYWRYGKGAEETDYLFCNEYGEQMTRSTLAKAMAHYNRSRGVEKTSIHLLRHTFAKKWITSGGDIITLARVLTHNELEIQRASKVVEKDTLG